MDKLLDSPIASADAAMNPPPFEHAESPNPVAHFSKAWRILERIAVSLSLVVVLGTIGYVSIYKLA